MATFNFEMKVKYKGQIKADSAAEAHKMLIEDHGYAVDNDVNESELMGVEVGLE